MDRTRRLGLQWGLAAASLPGWALAQNFPARPITWVVPFPAGGVTDLTARALAGPLGAELGTTIVIENKAGASGIVGTEQGARARPDGHTLVFGASGTLAANAALFKKLPYTPASFEPIGAFARTPLLLVVRSDGRFQSLAQLLAHAKQHPEDIKYGSAGSGSAMNLACELMQQATQVKLLHVPYKGSAEAMTSLLGGTIDLLFDYGASVQPHLASGRISALAVTTPARISRYPRVATFAEQGHPSVELAAWFGLLAPAGTPPDVLAKIETALRKARRHPDFVRAVEEQGGQVPQDLDGPAFRRFIDTEVTRWAALVAKAGLKPE